MGRCIEGLVSVRAGKDRSGREEISLCCCANKERIELVIQGCKWLDQFIGWETGCALEKTSDWFSRKQEYFTACQRLEEYRLELNRAKADYIVCKDRIAVAKRELDRTLLEADNGKT